MSLLKVILISTFILNSQHFSRGSRALVWFVPPYRPPPVISLILSSFPVSGSGFYVLSKQSASLNASLILKHRWMEGLFLWFPVLHTHTHREDRLPNLKSDSSINLSISSLVTTLVTFYFITTFKERRTESARY